MIRKGDESVEVTSELVSILPILLVNFIGTLGFSIVLPFLVFLVTRFGGNALVFGLMAAMYPLFQLIGSPILGRWSDIYGRKKVLLLSQAGTTAAWGFFIVALFLPISPLFNIKLSSFGMIVVTIPLLVLFFARALDGITGGNVSVANAYIGDISSEENRSRNFGKMAISANLGFIVGPALAGVLGSLGEGELLPVLAAFFISVGALIVIFLLLQESLPCVNQPVLMRRKSVRRVFGQELRDCVDGGGSKKMPFRDILRLDFVPFMLLLYFVIFLGFNIFYSSFPIHSAEALRWSIGELGIFFSVLSLMMVVVQGPVLSWLSKRVSDPWLIIVGNMVLGSNFVLLLSSNIWVVYGAAILFAVGNGLMWPSILSLLSRVAGRSYQGAVQGFAGSFGSLSSIVGLIVGGVLYTFLGASTFLISAVCIYVAVVLSFQLLTGRFKSIGVSVVDK